MVGLGSDVLQEKTKGRKGSRSGKASWDDDGFAVVAGNRAMVDGL